MSLCFSCGLNMPTSPKSIISGKISIMGLTARPEVAMSTITAPTATTITTGSRIFITGGDCGFCAAGTGSARKAPVGGGAASIAASGAPVVGASTWS